MSTGAVPEGARPAAPAPRGEWQRALVWGLGAFFFLRLFVLAWGMASQAAFPLPPLPLDSPYMHGFVPTPAEQASPWLESWLRWDATWYLRIAQSGYSAGDGSVAFFPLYPLLVRGVAWLLGGRTLWAGLLVSNLAAAGFLVVFFRLAGAERGAGAARPALEAFVSFPTAFFLVMPYTESLFLLLSAAAFFLARRERWWWAGLLGALAALTRPHGLFLLPALGLVWLAGRRRWWTLLPLALIPLATGLFAAYASLVVEHAPFWAAQQYGWDQHWTWPWLAVWEGLRNLGEVGPAVLLSLLTLCLVLIPLVLAVRRLPPGYWVYSFLVLGLCMAKVDAQGVIVSMHRFVLMVFPAFILLGEVLSRRRSTWFVWRWLGLTVQAVAVVAFVHWGGVW